MQTNELSNLQQHYNEFQSLTTPHMDLKDHVLRFCGDHNLSRLALIDLLHSTTKDAEELDDVKASQLLQANLQFAPACKVHSMFSRVVATVLNPDGLNNPVLPYSNVTVPLWVRSYSNVPNPTVSSHDVAEPSDDDDGIPEPKKEIPATITLSEEKEEFWNPPNRDSKYWEQKWIIGISIVA